MTAKPLISFRRITDQDGPFILNSWLKSYRKESVYGREITAEVFYSNHKDVVLELLARSKVLVVCNPEYEAQVYGYAVYETRGDAIVIHFVYVKAPYRELGIGKAMLAVIQGEHISGGDLPIVATHATRMFHKLGPKVGATYNPYLTRNPDHGTTEAQAPSGFQRDQMRG